MRAYAWRSVNEDWVRVESIACGRTVDFEVEAGAIFFARADHGAYAGCCCGSARYLSEVNCFKH